MRPGRRAHREEVQCDGHGHACLERQSSVEAAGECRMWFHHLHEGVNGQYIFEHGILSFRFCLIVKNSGGVPACLLTHSASTMRRGECVRMFTDNCRLPLSLIGNDIPVKFMVADAMDIPREKQTFSLVSSPHRLAASRQDTTHPAPAHWRRSAERRRYARTYRPSFRISFSWMPPKPPLLKMQTMSPPLTCLPRCSTMASTSGR